MKKKHLIEIRNYASINQEIKRTIKLENEVCESNLRIEGFCIQLFGTSIDVGGKPTFDMDSIYEEFVNTPLNANEFAVFTIARTEYHHYWDVDIRLIKEDDDKICLIVTDNTCLIQVDYTPRPQLTDIIDDLNIIMLLYQLSVCASNAGYGYVSWRTDADGIDDFYDEMIEKCVEMEIIHPLVCA